MIRIDAPASSANLGPGFDCLGLALNIYNTYEAELWEYDLLENAEERYRNSDNLFLQAYRKGCEAIGVNDHVRVRFECRIPSTRGLGSSAAFITAGVAAASALHGNALSKEKIFELITEMEGHPDNTAPCLYGGLTASAITGKNTYVTRQIETAPSLCFTVLIPDYEVDTKTARKALPQSYSRSDTAVTAARAILSLEALRTGDIRLLKQVCRDVIHEPYRAKLIHGFEEMRSLCEADTDGRLVISGSGPACLLISERRLCEEAKQKLAAEYGGLMIKEVRIAEKGLLINGEPL